MIFAAVLKELMRQRGWTPRDLSLASGISQRQISNLVKGMQSASLDTAEAIAQAFDMQTWHLLIRTTGLPPHDRARLRRVIRAFLGGYHR
jgi:transcriptional regulator with XRE-family HTH domain